VTTTSELLLRYDQQRARAKQLEIGISDIGGCRRRAGYRLAQTEPSDAGGSVQAAMGSAIHETVAASMAQVAEPGDLIEHEVRFGGILGHLDRYEAATCTVQDTKTTSSRWAEHLKLHGPDQSHLWQVNIYGAALVRQGVEVRRVRIDYLARDTGEEWSWEGSFQPEMVREAFAWLKNVRETPLDMLPRDYMPDSAFCHSCRFASLCWPYGLEGRGPAKVITEEGPCLHCDLHAYRHADSDHPFEPSAPHWAQTLWDAKEAERAAKAQAERARLALEALRPMAGTGLVDAGEHRLRYGTQDRGGKSTATLRFVSKRADGRQPAVGYEEGDA
jgi:CRISPR/Cas system-associated exonuclease Cas4 (RecB family)